MSRNFGLGSRNMDVAARIALKGARERKEISFSTEATVLDRFRIFVEHAKRSGVNRMEKIDANLLVDFGVKLATQALDDELSAAYCQNLVSSVNTVMRIATQGQWRRVSPTKECGIQKRSAICTEVPSGYSRDQYVKSIDGLTTENMHRQAAIAQLAREWGLRTKEASLLDVKKALRKVEAEGGINITRGTKGGLKRFVPLSSDRRDLQLGVLYKAAELQGDQRNLIPGNLTWEAWRDGGLRDGREVLQKYGVRRYHDLRSAYACERYREFCGSEAPVITGHIFDQRKDLKAREQVAKELGHGRINIMSEYIGGRK